VLRHSRNIQKTFKEHSENIQGTFREHSRNMKGGFWEHSENMNGTGAAAPPYKGAQSPRAATFKEYEGNVQGT
jgi:hypothetical protein